jgi:hypothetical protein
VLSSASPSAPVDDEGDPESGGEEMRGEVDNGGGERRSVLEVVTVPFVKVSVEKAKKKKKGLFLINFLPIITFSNFRVNKNLIRI